MRWRAVCGGLDAAEEVAVGDAFRGEGAPGGEFVEPEAGHVRGGEVLGVALQQQEIEEGVVEVVVLGHAVDVLGEGGAGRAAVPGVGAEERPGDAPGGEVGGQRPVAGGLGELADAGEGQLLDRLAQQAADRTAQPGGVQAGLQAGRGGGARGEVTASPGTGT
ncbi:hypothetical protein GCM10020295_62740 [Streptomyces cinereospinus]